MEFSKVKRKSGKVKAFLRTCLGSCILMLGSAESKAQSFSDLFGQGGKLLKNMGQQIAALAAFENSVRQGYNMAKGEWGLIGSFKDGELTLHQNYYSSLSQVSPLVKNSTDIASIQSEQQSIISQFNSLNGLSGLSANEYSYIKLVGQSLVTQCNRDLDELQSVLTPGQLAMTDDERIKRISRVSAAIKDKYVFSCSFCTQVRILAAQRNNDGNNNEAVQKLYGINPN